MNRATADTQFNFLIWYIYTYINCVGRTPDTNSYAWNAVKGFSTFSCFVSFIFRHPHGKLASFVLSHCGSAILLAFVLSPILCLPTYFLFGINEAFIVNAKNVSVHIYHVNVNEGTALYRWVRERWEWRSKSYFLIKCWRPLTICIYHFT